MVPFHPPDRLHVVDRQFGGRSAPLFTSSSRALNAVLAGAESSAEKLARIEPLLPEECSTRVAHSVLSPAFSTLEGVWDYVDDFRN